MTPRRRLVAPVRPLLRLLCRLAAAASLATCSGALAAQEHQAFDPGCALPFESLRVTHPIDIGSVCGRNGSPTQDAGLAAGNTAKNNFCAKGPPVIVTHATFAQLQSAVDTVMVPAGPRRQPADRSVLHNLLTIRPGVKIGEGSLVQLVTFIVTAHFADVAQGETVNCKLSGKENNDIHVVLGESPDVDLCHSVTAEISPHLRPLEWEDFVLDRVERPVRITGQLFFDGIHVPCQGGRPRPGGPSRLSVWEIHPVYGIEVCTASSLADCPAGDPSRWQPIDPLAARNRAGLEYLAQGRSADAVRIFAGAEAAILASHHTAADKARFLYNYGAALEQSHQSAAAANLFLRALQLDAGVKEPLTALLKLPGTAIAKPSEALGTLIDRLLAQGDVAGAANTVRYALVQIPPGDGGFEDGLARLLITYLTAAAVGPRGFRSDWQPLIAQRLPTLGPLARARLTTVQRLYLGEIPVIFRQEEAARFIAPWKPCNQAMTHTVPPQPCDAVNLVSLLQVIGDGLSREGSPQGALSRYALAWSSSWDVAAAIQVAGLLLANPQLDTGRLKEKGFIASLFERKREAYPEGDLITAFRLHVVLASLFERSKTWGSEREPASAIFQLSSALQVSQKLDARAFAQRDAIPALHARLARAYDQQRRNWDATAQYLASARSYLEAGSPEGADSVLFLAEQILVLVPDAAQRRQVDALMLQAKQAESVAASHRTPSDSATTERVLARLRADPALRLDQLHVSTEAGVVSISGEGTRSSWPEIDHLVTSTVDVKAVRQVPEGRGSTGPRPLDARPAPPATPGLLPPTTSGAVKAVRQVPEGRDSAGARRLDARPSAAPAAPDLLPPPSGAALPQDDDQGIALSARSTVFREENGMAETLSRILNLVLTLASVYLLMGAFCMTLNEWISGLLNLRGKMLARGLRVLLGEQSHPGGQNNDQLGFITLFNEHPLISRLRSPGRNVQFPAYLWAPTFATVVMELATVGKKGPITFDDLEAGVNSLADGDVKRIVLALIQNSARDLAKAQLRIEDWFNEFMDLVTGWYKRRIHVLAIAIALILSAAMNADTIHMARILWLDSTMRVIILDEAKARAAQPGLLHQYTKALEPLLGWSEPPRSLGAWLSWLFGITLTTVAVSLAAALWFDSLKRLVNLRMTGKSPDERAQLAAKSGT